MTKIDKDRKLRPVLSDEEFDLMFAQARVNDCSFLALRNPAILCILRITGKRREEVAGLKRRDIYLDAPNLAMNFKLLKKHKEKPPEVVRFVSLDESIVQPILDYKRYIDDEYPNSPEFWLRTRFVFGNPIIYPNKGISGRQVYNIVRNCGDAAGVIVWPHLFRETVGAEEIRRDPSQYGVAKVMRRIDVTERTAWRYMERHILSVIKTDYRKRDDPE